VQGGDRLPWVKADVNGTGPDNFAPLRSMDWQVHVYGDTAAQVRELCATQRLPLHVFPWRAEMGGAGLLRDAVYLVRPDGYIGLADSTGGAAALTSYLDVHRITAGNPI
jgi:hypothetical protein